MESTPMAMGDNGNVNMNNDATDTTNSIIPPEGGAYNTTATLLAHLQYLYSTHQPSPTVSSAERSFFYVITAIICWKAFWLIMARHGDDNRYIFLTYFMLYVTYMVVKWA
ncbi:hypothetical protein K402DRAFT_417583 [Aulographum hederae CBS 113979]|uniref:Uncharacterized protein n=1 Tax=Aulographum hederae CBS 113979 TaxID=1176131 RepID=A0A6G1HCP2_9PEZI|nr:hypothetical protein K402DRAFT_417583 [Aulographum hederae CBS 113979]